MKRLITSLPIFVAVILCASSYAELAPQFLFGHTGRVFTVTFSSDGNWLASGGGGVYEIRIWDTITNEQIYDDLIGHKGKIKDLDFRANGDLASASDDGTVRLWNVPDRREMRVFEGHAGQVTSVDFHPNGKQIVSGSRDRTLKLWDAETGELLTTFEGHRDVVWSVAFSLDGEMIASGSEDGTVRLWNPLDGSQIRSFEHTGGVLSAAFHPDETVIASGTRDGIVRLWNVNAVQPAGVLNNTDPFAIYDRQVLSVRFSPDGRLLAVGLLDSPADNTLKLWDVSTHRELRSFDTKIKHDLAFNPNRSQLAVAGVADGTVTVWNSSRLKPTLVVPQAGELVESLQVALRWEAVENAIYYDVEIASDSNFAQTTQLTTVTADELLFEADNNIPGYWWRVRTGSFVGVSGWSEARLFRTPVCVVRIVPPNRRVNLEEEFAIEVWIDSVIDLAGFQFDLRWTNPDVLKFVTVTKFRDIFGESGLGQQPTEPADQENGIYRNIVAATTAAGGVDGSGALLGVLFRAQNIGDSEIQLENLTLANPNGQPIHYNIHPSRIVVENLVRPWDVNRDKTVNIFDLIIVAKYLGQPIPTDAEIYPDVNGDGAVNLDDFELVGSHFGESYAIDEVSAAPPAMLETGKPRTSANQTLHTTPYNRGVLSPSARRLLESIYLDLLSNPKDSPAFIHTIQVLQRLLVLPRPKQDVLLQNYPNPFNPETWIPFHLALASRVIVEIHNAAGISVRQFDLGHLVPGRYVSRADAAYWDGKNIHGEPVAGGIYFYTLSAESFRATRKMIITK